MPSKQIEHLLAIARGDTGQSRRVADFLLAWWNAGSCGGFDFTTFWGMDDELCVDSAGGLVRRVPARVSDAFGYGP